MKLARAEDVQSVNSVLESYDLFRRLLQYSTDNPEKSLEDSFIEYEVCMTPSLLILQVTNVKRCNYRRERSNSSFITVSFMDF